MVIFLLFCIVDIIYFIWNQILHFMGTQGVMVMRYHKRPIMGQ